MKLSLVNLLGLTAFASAATVNVQVGKNGLRYTPSVIKADIGDKIVFHWAAGDHTVTQGNFKRGCAQQTGGFNSGEKNQGQTWTLTVKDDKPMPFFCLTFGHCSEGMYGVINPSGKDDYNAYRKLVLDSP